MLTFASLPWPATDPHVPTPPSIHVLEPLEQGGVIARQGFSYQDHVTAAFVLEMVSGEPTGGLLAAVWCESEDDITLIWQRASGEHVEFVQVKRNELEQLWTAAKICERDSGSAGTRSGTQEDSNDTPRSLAEKSLAHDRCAEPCTFRVVSAWELHPDLEVLRLSLEHPHRVDGHEKIEAIVADIGTRAERARRFVSRNGHDVRYWVRRLRWDVRGRLEAVRSRNLETLERFAESAGAFLAQDQRAALYQQLLALVKQAADAPWLTEEARKKLPRAKVTEFFSRELQRAQNPSLAAGGEVLRQELRNAGLSPQVVESACDLRHRYRRERLAPRYLSVDDAEMIEGEVGAVLHDLGSQFNAGILLDTPVQFHERCRAAVVALHGSLAFPTAPPLFSLLGAMYDRVHRGLHRFTRPDLADMLGEPSNRLRTAGAESDPSVRDSPQEDAA